MSSSDRGEGRKIAQANEREGVLRCSISGSSFLSKPITGRSLADSWKSSFAEIFLAGSTVQSGRECSLLRRSDLL